MGEAQASLRLSQSSPGAKYVLIVEMDTAPGAIHHLDPSNQQPRLTCFLAAQEEGSALAAMSHLEELILTTY